MIVKLAEHYGLCFGVRDAIAQADQLAADGPLTILGELVHNPVVRDGIPDAKAEAVMFCEFYDHSCCGFITLCGKVLWQKNGFI